MNPRLLRTIELLSGLGAGLLGLVIPGYALLVGVYPYVSESGDPSALLVHFAAVLLVAGAAYLDSRVHLGTGIGLSLTLLWVGAATLWVFVLLPGLSVNVQILPAAVLALVASLAGSWARLEAGPV